MKYNTLSADRQASAFREYRNLTLRHAHKINLGDRVIVDDNAVLDAKGDDNNGITRRTASPSGRPQES